MTQASRHPLRLLATATLAIAVLAGCSTVKNAFGGRDKDKAGEPTALAQIVPTANVGRLWSASIGKGGERLRAIGSKARVQMQALFDRKVFLETWVRVREGWSNDEAALRTLGYHD